MNKTEFLEKLKCGLSGLPQNDIEERVNFYSEMIDDRMEEGYTEEAAIAEIGTVEKVVSQILDETPLSKIVKEKVRPKRVLRVWEIILLIVGSPLWISLLAVLAVLLMVCYILIWIVPIVMWAIAVCLGCGGLVSIFPVAVLLYRGEILAALAILGAGLFCLGLAILAVFLSRSITKGCAFLSKKLAHGVKYMFVGKGSR